MYAMWQMVPARAACTGHQGVHGGDPTRRLAAGSAMPSLSD